EIGVQDRADGPARGGPNVGPPGRERHEDGTRHESGDDDDGDVLEARRTALGGVPSPLHVSPPNRPPTVGNASSTQTTKGGPENRRDHGPSPDPSRWAHGPTGEARHEPDLVAFVPRDTGAPRNR